MLEFLCFCMDKGRRRMGGGVIRGVQKCYNKDVSVFKDSIRNGAA